jgi:hypothetical protein
MGREKWSPVRAATCACLLAPSAIEACTFINKYDALVPQEMVDASSPDSSIGDAGGPDATESENAPDVVVAPQPVPSDGVVVIGGTVSTDAGDQYVLTALDPRTGSEFPKARVAMTVAAVLYDPGRDYWYVFESGGQGIYPTPTDSYFLHVRKIDRVTGTWTELAEVQVPPGVSFLTTAVLGDAITYVAYGAGPSDAAVDDDAGAVNASDGGVALLPNIPAKYGLVTIDTQDLTSLTACVLPLSAAPTACRPRPRPSSARRTRRTLRTDTRRSGTTRRRAT